MAGAERKLGTIENIADKAILAGSVVDVGFIVGGFFTANAPAVAFGALSLFGGLYIRDHYIRRDN